MTSQGGQRTREGVRHWLPSQGVDPAPLAELNSECLGAVSPARRPNAKRSRPPRRCCCRCASNGRRCRHTPCGGCPPRHSASSMPASPRRRAGSRCARAGVHELPQRVEPAYFPPDMARSITRRMLVYGWHLARSRPRVACLVFGSTMAGIESLAACSLASLEAAADRNAESLRPRWSNQTAFWRELLLAASAGADRRLHELLLGGVQRLAAETLAAHAP